MDLFADFKREIENDLNSLGIRHAASSTIEEVLILRYTHMRKTIRAAKRATHQSPEFQKSLAGCTLGEQAAMADILAKFSRGGDVNGHLSHDSIDPGKVDGLLYDWDVYHLHVSNTKRNPAQKFYDRSGPVALVKVGASDAYFIDIRLHGVTNPLLWTETSILEIIDRNWPYLLDPFTLHSIAVASQPSASVLKLLRGDQRTGKGAVIPTLAIGNRIIAVPGGGMATDGTPNEVMERVDWTLYAIKDMERYFKNHGPAIKNELESRVNVAAGQQDFKLVRVDGYWKIAEKASGKPLDIRDLNLILSNLPAQV